MKHCLPTWWSGAHLETNLCHSGGSCAPSWVSWNHFEWIGRYIGSPNGGLLPGCLHLDHHGTQLVLHLVLNRWDMWTLRMGCAAAASTRYGPNPPMVYFMNSPNIPKIMFQPTYLFTIFWDNASIDCLHLILWMSDKQGAHSTCVNTDLVWRLKYWPN